MIAPPHYRCETVTLEKQKGIQRLEDALKIVEKAIKERQGSFKLVNKPQVIGAKEDKDIEDIMANINDRKDEDASSGDEDNEEGMDVDLEGDDGRINDGGDDEEEKKESKPKKKSSKKKAKGSDNDSEDDG
jgi:hypothetical protein